MNVLKHAAVLLGLALPLGCLAQGITFTDSGGKMTLTNITSWSTRLGDAGTLHFKAAGNKLKGTWSGLGLTVNARAIEGDAKRVGGALQLIRATVTGDVHMVAVRTNQTVTCDSASAVITADGDAMDVKLNGGVNLLSESSATGEITKASGADGTARIVPTLGLSAASLVGQVALDMTRKTNAATTHVVAHSKRLDINRASDPPTMTLKGDVIVQGNDPVVAGEIRASSVVITMDAQGQPIGVDAEGDPGVMRFKQRGGGTA